MVLSSGVQPNFAWMIRQICAADRDGFSFFKEAASSMISGGVRGRDCLGEGTSASKPPRFQSVIHRSSVQRVIRTGLPSGSVCTMAAKSRTRAPRWRLDRVGSAASLISM